MKPVYEQDRTFEKLDGVNNHLQKGEYENCIFNSCELSNADLADYIFIDCTFNNCNLSLTNTGNTVFRDVVFKNCKMLAIRFDTCNKFGLAFQFEHCTLDHSSFFQSKINGSQFKECQLHEVDFTEADLSTSVFTSCDLKNAKFENTNMEKADFRKSYNYSIDTDLNRIKKAKFSLPEVLSLLDKYDLQIEK